MEIDKSLEAGFARALERDPHDAGTLGMWSDFKEELGELEAANRLRVHALLGKNYLGPEAYTILGDPLTGEVAPLPREVHNPAFWEQPCPISQDGRTVAETHRLAYIPGDMTLLKLRELAIEAQARLGRPTILHDQDWYEGPDFATRPYAELSEAAGVGKVEGGRWVLLPERDLPGSRGKPYAGQEVVLARYPNYRTALAVELVSVLVLDDVQNRPAGEDRLFSDFWAFCADTVTERGVGRRVFAGYFDAYGLDVDRDVDGFWGNYLGRAVVWKFSEKA